MSSTHSLSKSAEALSAIVRNPRVSKEVKHSTLNRMDGIRPRSVGEPSAGASSSRGKSRSRERSRGSEDHAHRRLRNPLHRLVALFVGEKIPEVHRGVTERGIPTQHAREDPRSVQNRSREVHTSQKPRQVPVPGQVQERHPHHSHSHRETTHTRPGPGHIANIALDMKTVTNHVLIDTNANMNTGIA